MAYTDPTVATFGVRAIDANPQPLAPRLQVEKSDSGAITISPEHPDMDMDEATALVMSAVGADDLELYRGFVDDLAQLATVDGELNEHRLNFLISAVKGLQPKGQTEAVLAAQMAAVHSATLHAARGLCTPPRLWQYMTRWRKLSRTFASQLEALRKYRTGGEQRVTVQHVNVNEGGQATVGVVSGEGV